MEDRRGPLSRSISRLATLAVATALAFAAGPAAAGTLGGTPRTDTARSREAADHALHGRYDAVVALLENVKDRSPEEMADFGRALRFVGRRADARKVLAGCDAAACVAVLARLELEDGDRRLAVKLLTKAVARFKQDLALRVLYGRALYAVGQDMAARKILDPIADLYGAGKITSVAEMVATAESLAANGFFKDANQVLADASEAVAEKTERKQVERVWGWLFLDKYNFRDADTAFSRVLKLDPHDESAIVGMARIDLDSDHDVARARKRLDALLKTSPRAPHALVARAEVAIHDEAMEEAGSWLDKAAAIAPTAPDYLAVRYAWARLLDDAKTAKRTLATAHKLDPTDGIPHLVAAQYLEQAHRYDEVRAELLAALKRDPELWKAHAQLGLAWSRVADDVKALEHLETAFRNDPFNVRTANLLNVLYDGVLRQMVLLPGKSVELRVHRRDRRALERTVLPFLQESYATLAKRYAMEAKPPLRVEIFPTTEQFSVRTVGLPRLGAHAVCFGHLITSRSPMEAPFNWKMVLHHEMAHVFHIQATEGRVPRWLTEGLAMMESAWLDPRYHMVMERQLYDRARDAQLSPIATFNLAFSQARSMQDIVGAYYQAMWLVRFLDATYGFDKLRKLVAAHRSGKPTEQLIQQVYGKSASAVDGEFAAWLGKELKRFDRDFQPTPAQIGRLVAQKLPATASAETAAAHKALSSWKRAFDAGDNAGAFGAVRGVEPKAGAAPPGVLQCSAWYLAMEASTARGASKKAAAFAEAMIAASDGTCDGVAQRIAAARPLATDAETRGKAEAHLDAALAIDPRNATLLATRLVLARKSGSLDAAGQRAMLRRLVELAPNDVSAAERLAKLAWSELAPAVQLDGIPLKATAGAAADAATPPSTAEAPALPAAGSAPAPALPGTAPAATPTVAEKTAPLTASQRAALVRDLRFAQQQLEETAPAGRLSVLYEARVAVAEGRARAALPLYRLAADRGSRARHRAEAWCELERVATRAAAKDDAAEAARRCGVARRGAPAAR